MIFLKKRRQFLLEVLVPATEEQLAAVDGDVKRFERELRPDLTIQALQELQQAGLDPEIWKLEGLETKHDVERIAAVVHKHNPKSAIVILGRGESKEKAQHWLREAKGVAGVIGFAIGRTVFLEPLKAYAKGQCKREEAVQAIAKNYSDLVKTWKGNSITAE